MRAHFPEQRLVIEPNNNLDVEPFVEALESMRDSYTGLGLNRHVQRCDFAAGLEVRNTLKKNALGEEAYQKLK